MPPIQSKPEFPEKLKAAHFKKGWSYSLSRNSAQAHILVYSTASIIHVSEGGFCNSLCILSYIQPTCIVENKGVVSLAKYLLLYLSLIYNW